MTRFRNFVFTLNNYTDADITLLDDLPTNYMVYGKEVGESGTPHLQGYIELSNQLRLSTIKKSMPRAHLEKRKGTPAQAADYCKKDGDFVETGTISNPGKRTDLLHVMHAIKKKRKFIEIAEEFPNTVAKHLKFFDRYQLELNRQDNKFQPVDVIVLYGAAGTGKTRKAYDIDPNLYHTTSTDWWDGYNGQDTILIDDFYGGIKYSKFLQLIDGYRYQLPIKGAFTWKQWKTIIITSNQHPKTWYSRGMTDALKRRISKIEKFEKSEEGGGIVLPTTSESNL